MSAEKRKVTTDALETLGTIIDNTAGRDAIHLAVEPIEAAEVLYAGQHVGIVDGKATIHAKKKLGIVDPFITGPIPAGSIFWFVVYPRQITSLRHVWSHPDFPEKAIEDIVDKKKVHTKVEDFQVSEQVKKETKETYDKIADLYAAEEWIKAFAARIPLDYDTLMQGAYDYQCTGEYMNYGSLLDGEYVPDEFWDHYKVVTGKEANNRSSFFSCSC